MPGLPHIFRRVLAAAAVIALVGTLARFVHADELPSQDTMLEQGKAIYEKSCVVCHGKQGKGVPKFSTEPLVGDLPIGDLSEVIAETMPEDDPEACVGPEAQAVAAYIHAAFYSEAVQEKLRPPHIGLARLTKIQLRQSLADLYAYDSGALWSVQDRGLKGVYFDGSKSRNRTKRIERTDAVLDFDFGDQGPGEGINPKNFFIDWRGAIQADSTGTYEFVIQSSCAFVCYLGAYDRKFIDNYTQSGDKTEFRQSIVLTAGRIYPFRIEFYHRDRNRKLSSNSHLKFQAKNVQPPAKISLSWTTPHGTEETIPSQNLIPVTAAPAAFSLQTRLPPDDRTYGYERGISVDRQWDTSTTESALEFAQIAADELWPRYQSRHKANKNRSQLRGFLDKIIATAFRGPLSKNDRKRYVDDPVDVTEDDIEAIRRSLLLALKSPRFLYPMLDSDRSASQRAANRLALALFDSLPTDPWLFRQARSNNLKNETQIRAAAERMVYDYRTRAKVRALIHGWLNIENVVEITKDTKKFEGFDAELLGDLRLSLDGFVDAIVWSDASDYRQLLLADWAFTTDRLARFYGDAWRPAQAGGRGLQRSVSDPDRRFGILTHPYLMSKMAYHDTTSPIHRGVFLTRYLLGRTLRPPQEAFAPLAAELHPDLTTRERVLLQTSDRNCQACHKRINGLGFTLEHFDAVGRYRNIEKKKPIDASGSYTARNEKQRDLAGPQQLALLLANGEDAQHAFVNRAFQHLVKQPVAAYGPGTMKRLTDSFEQSGYNIRQLLVEIAVIAAMDFHEKEPSDEKQDDPA